VKNPVSNFAFQMQPAALHRGEERQQLAALASIGADMLAGLAALCAALFCSQSTN
jgi:hypothetical protein